MRTNWNSRLLTKGHKGQREAWGDEVQKVWVGRQKYIQLARLVTFLPDPKASLFTAAITGFMVASYLFFCQAQVRKLSTSCHRLRRPPTAAASHLPILKQRSLQRRLPSVLIDFLFIGLILSLTTLPFYVFAAEVRVLHFTWGLENVLKSLPISLSSSSLHWSCSLLELSTACA